MSESFNTEQELDSQVVPENHHTIQYEFTRKM